MNIEILGEVWKSITVSERLGPMDVQIVGQVW